MNVENEESSAESANLQRLVVFREWFKPSEYPADFVPNGGKVFIGVDHAKDGLDCTVKGFYKDGKYHVQSVEYRGA